MRLIPPGAAARTSCKLGFQRRLLLLLAWLTLLPTEGRLPQIAQCLIVIFPCSFPALQVLLTLQLSGAQADIKEASGACLD